MSFGLITIYLIYIVVGLCTIYILSRYRMRVAYIAYTAVFPVLLVYLPVYAGNEIGDSLRTCVISNGLFTALSQNVENPFAIINPTLTYSFIIAIVLSVFLCVSAIAAAILAIEAVYRLCKKGRAPRFVYPRVKLNIKRKSRVSSRRLHLVLCRYNC